MNPFEILGCRLEDVEDKISHSGVEEVCEDLEEGEEQQYSLSGDGDAWEASLGEGNIIETIFIYKPDLFSSSLGFGSHSTTEEIEKLYGPVKSSGKQSQLQFLGTKGAWERYDTEKFALHIEHEIDSFIIKMVTIMTVNVAP